MTSTSAARNGELDFDRPNVVAFRHFETQVAALQDMGVEADVIVFHPYDRWGYCAMSPDQDERYVRYLVARLGASAMSGGRSPTNTTSFST